MRFVKRFVRMQITAAKETRLGRKKTIIFVVVFFINWSR